jgi:hypothetical protein
MNYTIENIIKKNQYEATFSLKNSLNEELYCNAILNHKQQLKELLVLNQKNWTYESIINLYSEPILSTIETVIKN